LTKFPLTVQQEFMAQSIELATAAGAAQEVPVGAIVVDGQGQIIGRGENRRERDVNPTAHSEIIALRQAGQLLGNWHYNSPIV
jgi:tRNA(adenine34) deaminase